MADEQNPISITPAGAPEPQAEAAQAPEPVAASVPEETPAAPAMPSMPVVETTEENSEGAASEVAESAPEETPVETAEAPAPQEPAEVEELKQDENNVFTELFGKGPEKDEGMVDSVLGQKDQEKKSFFDDIIEPDSPEKRGVSRKVGKAVFQVGVVLLVLCAGFFATQNIKQFTLLGANPALKAEQAENQVMEIQGEIHVQNHLAAVLLLDQSMQVADDYFYNLAQAESEFTSKNKREKHAEKVEELQGEMIELLGQVQERLKADPSREEMPFAKAAADTFIKNLKAKEGSVDAETLRQEIHDFETAKTLMMSQQYKDLVIKFDTENWDDDALRTVMEDYSSVNMSVSSNITSIRDARVHWNQLWDEIESVVKDVDPLFNTEFTGNLSVNSIKFRKGQVDINGKSMTDDTKNFTLISNLIDALEASELFMNVEERSFSKSSSGDDSYTGNFRLSLEIE